MALTFADTHNMITLLTKSDASEGFEQIINFLNASVIQYALMQVNDDVVDDVADVVADAIEPTPPSPTTTPPPLQQELIPSTFEVAPTLPPSPHQSPIAQPSSPPQPQPLQTHISMDLLNTLLETCTTLTRKVENLEQDKLAQAFEITKLKQRVRRLEKKSKLKASRDASKQKGKIAEIDADEDVTLEEVATEVPKDADAEPAEFTKVIEVVTTAKLMTEVVTASATTTATIITVAPMPAASAARRRKGIVIRDPEEIATPSVIVHSEPKSKDKGKGILVEEPKPLKKQIQIEQDEAYAK
nr:hypothetical protein [Tanacetum cinerariifolium]